MSERTPDGGGSRPGIGGDLMIPALALAFGAYFFVDIVDLDWEAKANGVVVGVLLVGLCLIQVARTLILLGRGEGSLALGRLIEPHDRLWQRIGIVALLALFVATITFTGATLGIYLLVLMMLLLLGARDWRGLVFVPLGVAATVYLLFIAFLHAKLPRGPVESLITATTGLGG